ncbi:ATP synthase F0F1 subunit gamma [Kiloniella litopenaei]|uniref:ATP synthase gamma chain n=1 Tax=Kiloniella litopenaei TaxID=1549748 RepID=A0A0M2R1P3_9PROT|nr:F0F1 ATP synthase subunit gamma [Kiloniella litopenaei]KKJ75566.1 ATP synthase F0F1 subunit gamma [Kiloniella litopenaei]
MPNLNDLKLRIASVKSTQKITSAMKMVAAAKLRRAQEQAEASRPYAERMERMLGSLAASAGKQPGASPLLAGTGKDDVHLLIVAAADRGLCGGFNSNIVREARNKAKELLSAGKTIKIYCVGRKSRDQLRRDFGDNIVDTIEDIAKPSLGFDKAATVADRVLSMFKAGEFDVCTIFYAKFQSAIAQIPTAQQLIPFEAEGDADASTLADGGVYDYEPSDEKILSDLLPRNIAVQIFKAMLENNASEHGARMSAMDNATRNAGEMIDKLSIQYNRTRQAIITNELIEIISAKEAL